MTTMTPGPTGPTVAPATGNGPTTSRVRLARGAAVLALALGLAPLGGVGAQDATPGSTPAAGGSTLYASDPAPTVPDATPGEISVVAYGDLTAYQVPILVVNGTDEAVEDIEISVAVVGGDATPVAGDGVPDDSVAAATPDAAGTPAADAAATEVAAVTGRSIGLFPDELAPGEVAIGAITFDGGEVLAGAELTFTVESLPVRDANVDEVDATVSDVTLADGVVTGTVTNETGTDIPRAVNVRVVCVATDGALTGFASGYLEEEGLAAGASQPFELDLPADVESCDSYFVAAQGRNF